jgi:hypothetical protein
LEIEVALAGPLEWLTGSPVAQALTASPTLYIFANAAHILSIGLLIGSIVPLDLRILGLFRRTSLQVLGPFLSGAAMVGVSLAISTGLVLFTVKADEYALNPAFLTKMGLLAAGLTNAALLHGVAPWARAPQSGEAPLSIKFMAGASLAIWISALIAGRWIGFL